MLFRSTNINIVLKVKDILDGNLTQSYEISTIQLIDIFLSSITMILCLLTVLFFILGLRRRKMNNRQPMTKKRVIATVALLITTILCVIGFTFPQVMGVDWSFVLIWQTYSILTTLISLTLLMASITWLVYTHRYIKR